MFKRASLRLLAILVIVGGMMPVFMPGTVTGAGAAIIIDHTCTDITKIPQSAILAAKQKLHIGYGHLSHGWQITQGMTGLVSFANNGGKGLSMPFNIFAFGNSDTGGVSLDIEEGYPNSTQWLQGSCGTLPGDTEYGYWADETREYLNSHPDVNVIMWAWCWELATRYSQNHSLPYYLGAMNQLEADYPNVKFVYMTSRLLHAEDAGVKAGNAAIRKYCIDNGKILYDFADIESYNPDGVYFEFTTQDCYYYSSATATTPIGNWATEWQNTHTLGVDWYYPGGVPPPGGPFGELGAAHTYPLNANLKAYAAWWLWARLAGWDGTNNVPPVTLAITTSALPNGTVGVAYSQPLAATGGTAPYTWSITSGTLPAGLSLSSGGVISGTPTAVGGPVSITFRVTDSASATATKPLSITIGAGLSITTSSLPNGTNDVPTLTQGGLTQGSDKTVAVDTGGHTVLIIVTIAVTVIIILLLFYFVFWIRRAHKGH